MPMTETEPRATSPAPNAEPHTHAICRGAGACSKSGCNCQSYEGSGSTCANSGCGHSYSDHW
jgi:hypothetical protein